MPRRALAPLALLVLAACGEMPAARKESLSLDAVATSPAAGTAIADLAAPPPPVPALAPAAAPARGEMRDARRGTAEASAGSAPQPAASASAAAVDPTAMVIRTGQASVQVDSLEPALGALRALATRLGGHVGNVALAAGRDQVRSATLQLRVPADRFDALVGGLSPLGKVETVNVQAEDVGEEYVDVTARAANARRLEARLVALLERGAPRLSDVLQVERELARVREEIERLEGRLRFLRARAALSTLEVTAHEPAPLVGPSPTANPLADAARQAWRNFLGLVAFAIASSGVLIPVGAVAALAWRLWPRRVRPAAPAR
ncbi:DUF4349 domain-containing protein, partial [Roseisolibacter sp. H3M3-2]|uniref:DUF4349 domain-containing protein n=1 Tax=Roseisolibacter sp. H3M3-2 TaxID=3031323 RepID=UPI0023DCB418